MTTDKKLTPITLDAAREALGYVSPAERRTRVRMGEALKDEFGDVARDVWDEWYQRHERYTATESKQAWRSFGKGGAGAGAATIGTLVYEAKRNGWRLNGRHHANRSVEEQAKFEAERKRRREEMAAEAAAAEARAAAIAAKVWAAASEVETHPYLTRKKIKAHGLRFAPVWIKEWTDPESGEVKRFEHRDALLVPIWSGPGRISSLQAIFPTRCIGRKPRDGEKDQRRDKDYLTDGRKLGCYHVIGDITADTHTILVAEGYATAATLHEVSGLPVLVAFDSGNLEPVAKMLRDKLPGARIVICADNDAFTKDASGKLWNPGMEAAKKAAKECAGIVAAPRFASDESEPTDWNDLGVREGWEVVSAQLKAALEPVTPAAADPAAAPRHTHDPADDEELEGQGGFFTILGYDHDRYYLLQRERKQISQYTKGDFTESGLLELAPLNWWEVNFPGEKGGIDRRMAMNWIIRTAGRRGIYDISRIRGRGAWVDADRMVYHHGSHLTVDGASTPVTAIRSRYVYELDRSLPEPAAEPLDGEDGERILELAQKFRWTKPGSAALLAGWVALAPLCGALKWRPHIWLTGGAGCGKSTVLNRFVHTLMAGCDVFAQGNSSEAGIRQTLKADALPVLFDESEKNTERERQRIDGVLALIRQASTESQARTLKGTAGGDSMAFHIRSMFCLASIQVGLEHQADVERLTVLHLKPKRDDPNAAETWAAIDSGLSELSADEELPARLLRRSLDLLPTTLQNIRVFCRAATRAFGSVREGDQYGTLLAGAWSLKSTRVATDEEADEEIKLYDWSEHLDSADTDESERALAALLEAHVRVQSGIELTVYELVRGATGLRSGTEDLGDGVCAAALERVGMRVERRGGEWRLLLSNTSQELKRLLRETPFGADLRGLLLRLPGADRWDNKPMRFNGALAKCTSLSLTDILGESRGGQKEAF